MDAGCPPVGSDSVGVLALGCERVVDDGGDEVAEILRIELEVVPLACAQISPADEEDGERVHVGGYRDASEAAFGREVGAEHPHDLGRDWYASRGGEPQSPTQLLARAHEIDDPDGRRRERCGEHRGDVACHWSLASRCTYLLGEAVEAFGMGEHERGEERVEISEVAVQDALGDARLGGCGPAGEGVRAVAQQDAFGGVEQLLADVVDRFPGRQAESDQIRSEWASAHYNEHMPTPPSAATTPPEPHRAREAAESFGTDPERYDRTRPRYPKALVDRIMASIPGRDVLDIGIGTGVSAQPFQTAGYTLVGVEVDLRMAEFARSRGFAVEVAKFEDWDPAGRSFDALIAGMTWHWVDPAAGTAKAAEVLRPHGLLALFWNVHQPPPELARAFAEVYHRVLPGTPFATTQTDPVAGYHQILDTACVGITATRAFTTPERLRFDWEHVYTRDEWLDQVPTFGGHSTLPKQKLDQLLAGIGAAIDQIGDSFTMRYATLAITTHRVALSESGCVTW